MLNVLEGLTYHSVSDTHSLSTEKNSTPKFALRNYPHSPEQIAQAMRVDEKGNLWWKTKRAGRKFYRKPLGTVNADGYSRVNFEYYSYQSHILCFCLYYGRWPQSGKVVDHINQLRYDNRKENLREVTQSQNGLNSVKLRPDNAIGYRNICLHKQSNLWSVEKTISGIRFNKLFKTLEEAIIYRDNKSRVVDSYENIKL